MVRDVLYAYSIDEKIRAYTYAVVFYFSVRMHRRNAVRAVGNRKPRLALERCRRSGHVLEVIRWAVGTARVAAGAGRFGIFVDSEFLF